uniref:Cysteine synthase family protein n=1 Tax=Thermofilum pendens TaxID=2269 RepID=A0A7C4B9I0_THEPE
MRTVPKAEEGVVGLIGCTPLVKLRKVASGAPVFVKLEYMNPTGSHKDRIALYMIREAEQRGLLRPGGLVVEASSGNTAISVAWLASQLGYRALIVVEEGVSPAKVALIRALGAEIVFAPRVPRGHPDHAVNLAERLAAERGGVFLNQFENEANVKAHYETTGPEIYRELGGSIGAFVMGIGTGGTIAGVAKFLRERRVPARIIGVVPKGSPIATGQQTLGEPIEGLATSTVSSIYTRYASLVDEVVEVGYEEARETMLKLAREEGVLGGLSTGANVAVALRVAERLERGVVATLAPDSIFRYTHLL